MPIPGAEITAEKDFQFSWFQPQFGDVLTTTTLGGQTTVFTYDIEGRRTSTTTSGVDPTTGQTVLFVDRVTYDLAGRVLTTSRVKSINGVETLLTSTGSTYDLNGKLLTSTDHTGLVTENTYDIRSQLIQTRRQAAGSDLQPHWYVSRTVYDAAGRSVISTESYREDTTDPIRGSRMTYDSVGQVTVSEQLFDVQVEITGSGSDFSTCSCCWRRMPRLLR